MSDKDSQQKNSSRALSDAARWCEKYFRARTNASVGHSMVSLLDLFAQMAQVQAKPDKAQSLKIAAIDERVEAYFERFARGDLSGIPQSSIPQPSNDIRLEIQGHVAFEGDTDWIEQPAPCGNFEANRAMQGFSIRLKQRAPVSLRYKAHLAFKGDTDWHDAGEFCGTRGEWRRVEAIWIDIEDDQDFDVYYSAHLSRLGWTGWFKNGQMCGTRGEYRQVEAIKVFVAESR